MALRYRLPLIGLGMACLLLAGCVNGYQKFYTPNPVASTTANGYLPFSGKTEIFGSQDIERDALSLLEKGYLHLGTAAFEGGGTATEAQLREQALLVGADVVLSKIVFEGSQTAQIPWTTYNPGPTVTTTSNGVVNANVTNNQGGAAYGTAVYSGTSTSTASGSYSTQMIPMTVNRYSWAATFWRKRLPPVFGARGDALTDELRRKYQRNAGVSVAFIVNDSPAFRANILKGDVITAIDDDEVISPTSFHDICVKHAGQKVTVSVLRGDEAKKIAITLNPAPH